MERRRARWAIVGITLCGSFAAGCGAPGDSWDDVASTQLAVMVPARGSASTFDVGSWNIEWLGDTANGPSNEALQLSNARDVIAGTDMDIWGVAESSARFCVGRSNRDRTSTRWPRPAAATSSWRRRSTWRAAR